MAISRDEVLHVARLARLALTDEEIVRLIERERIDVLSGLGLTNVMLAVTDPAVKADVIVLASHAGTGS